MAKIRLTKLRGGRMGWSVPYSWRGTTRRTVVPIDMETEELGIRGKSTGVALGDALNQAEHARNVASEPDRS